MIRFILILFGVLLASVYLGLWLEHDPGYVLVTVHHWNIETTFWIAALALVLLTIVLHIFLLTLRRIIGIPQYWRQWQQVRRLNKAQTKTKRGLIEFSEGHWHTAKKHLIAAAPNVDLPLVNYLTAAKAAEKLGDHRLRDQYLHQAQTAAPDATIAIELTQAQLQIDNQEWAEALETLKALQIIAPDHPYVMQLYVQVYQATQNWSELLAIIPKLKPSSTYSERDIQQLKKQAYTHLIQTWLYHSEPEASHKPPLHTLPSDLKHDPDIVAAYGRYLLHLEQYPLAEKTIRECLKHNHTSELITLYGQLPIDHTRISFIESLLRDHPESAALHLCLGQIFLNQKVWGTAKSHLEKSLELQPSSQAYHAIGTLFEALDQQSDACKAYKQGLEVMPQ